MCVNINNSQSQAYQLETSAKTENKNNIKQEKNIENKDKKQENTASTLSQGDNSKNVENYKISKHQANLVTFQDTDSESSGANKAESADKSPAEKISDEQAEKITAFVAKIKDETTEAVLKSFDLMLQHARKIMEENQKYIKTVVIPKEEAEKAEALRTGKQPIKP